MKRIVITPGEPAGIGPDITIQVAQLTWTAELIVVGDPQLLTARAEQLGLPLTLQPADLTQTPRMHIPGHLKIIPVTLAEPCHAGQLNPANAGYVLHCLELATHSCLHKHSHALVTGPVQKSILNAAHIPFMGHTEFLAKLCNAQALMLFVTKQVKVALVTTHIPLSQVPNTITPARLKFTLQLLHRELQNKFHISNPKIMVCGLNPHAGENGHLGKEEIEIIEPVLNELRKENIQLIGPLSADSVFTDKYLSIADVVLAMYHDQALPVIKYMSFGQAVNVTLGLPIIRTSVDHGTALDIAGTLQADAGSLSAAVQLATELASQGRPHEKN